MSRIDGQAFSDRLFEMFGHPAVMAIDDERLGTIDRKGRHRQAAGHGIELHCSQCIGETREYEDFAPAEQGCQIVPFFRTGKP